MNCHQTIVSVKGKMQTEGGKEKNGCRVNGPPARHIVNLFTVTPGSECSARSPHCVLCTVDWSAQRSVARSFHTLPEHQQHSHQDHFCTEPALCIRQHCGMLSWSADSAPIARDYWDSRTALQHGFSPAGAQTGLYNNHNLKSAFSCSVCMRNYHKLGLPLLFVMFVSHTRECTDHDRTVWYTSFMVSSLWLVFWRLLFRCSALDTMNV